MQTPEGLFFALLKAGLFGADVPIDALTDADWQAVYDMAREQTVTGVVAEAISRLPRDLQPPQAILQKFLSACVANMKANALLDAALAQLVRTYRDHGIEGLLLKGQGVARCYPQIYMRQGGDIDFYVGVGQYDQAVAIARQMAPESDGGHESYKHYEFHAFGASVELHRHAAMPLRPWLGSRLGRWTSSLLDDRKSLRKIDIGGETVYLPPVLFDAVFIFYHAAFHLLAFEGVGLRQLCDWALVMHVHQEEIDRNVLQKVLKSLALTDIWRVFGYIAVNYLGLPQNEMPLYSDSPRVRAKATKALEVIMNGGNFGHTLTRKAQYNSADPSLKGRLRRMRWQIHCSRQVFSVAPVDVGSNLLKFLLTGPFRVLRRRLIRHQAILAKWG